MKRCVLFFQYLIVYIFPSIVYNIKTQILPLIVLLSPIMYSFLPSNSRPSPEAGASGEERGQEGLQQQRQQQQPAPQRQIVARRFQIAFQLDLLLIVKLAAVIFLFNQDGSRQRLIVLIFFASLVYL